MLFIRNLYQNWLDASLLLNMIWFQRRPATTPVFRTFNNCQFYQQFHSGYDDRCDAQVSQEFATAAYRMGHTLIRDVFPRMNDFYQLMDNGVDLKTSFNNVTTLYDEASGGLETIIVGFAGAPVMAFDRHIATVNINCKEELTRI